MCNFELSPEAFRQRRLEMIALADERRLALAMKPARARRARTRRRGRVPVTGPVTRPVGLSPSPATG